MEGVNIKEDEEVRMHVTEQEEKASMVALLLDKAAHSSAHFKSQQLGEADLSLEEKRQIAKDLLAKGPDRFLARFHKHLNSSDVAAYFEPLRDDNYEVDFYLKEIAAAASTTAAPSTSTVKLWGEDSSSAAEVPPTAITAASLQSSGAAVTTTTTTTTVKNRRYNALKQLVEQGEYFSDAEMRDRNPLLFERLVGRYLSEEEKQEVESKIDPTDLRFSSILSEHISRNYQADLLRHQREEEEIEEFEEESDDDSSEEFEEGEKGQEEEMRNRRIPEAQKQMLREEFTSIMYQSFLNGKDTGFDYSVVDNNCEYDDLAIKQQDAEDRYFDSEEPD